jgi:4-amino-4-deoxy-L-arabinose transferase-like glycosyltransferase
MDLGILAALALIAVWAVVALGFNGPGWIHLLLTVGVATLIWRVAARSQKTKHP